MGRENSDIQMEEHSKDCLRETTTFMISALLIL
jgi:hypothetical protein